jgi:hypothetical protein
MRGTLPTLVGAIILLRGIFYGFADARGKNAVPNESLFV